MISLREISEGGFLYEKKSSKQYSIDLAFTYKGKTVALMITRFYDEGALEDISDEELRKMMSLK